MGLCMFENGKAYENFIINLQDSFDWGLNILVILIICIYSVEKCGVKKSSFFVENKRKLR